VNLRVLRFVRLQSLWRCNHKQGCTNSGFRLFGRIRMRIALPAEHFDAAPAVLIFSTSLNSCGCLYDRCLLSMLSSHDPLPFIRLPQSGGLSESSWHWLSEVGHRRHYSYALYRLTNRIRSDDTIRPNTNTLFGPLFGTAANTNRIFGTSLTITITKTNQATKTSLIAADLTLTRHAAPLELRTYDAAYSLSEFYYYYKYIVKGRKTPDSASFDTGTIPCDCVGRLDNARATNHPTVLRKRIQRVGCIHGGPKK